jgi:hypothetical protein
MLCCLFRDWIVSQRDINTSKEIDHGWWCCEFEKLSVNQVQLDVQLDGSIVLMNVMKE